MLKLLPLLKDGINALIHAPPKSGKSTLTSQTAIHRKQAIILVPTKELAVQQYRIIRQLDPTIRVARFGSISTISPIVELISDKSFDQSQFPKLIQNSQNRILDWDNIDICVSTPRQILSILQSGPRIRSANTLIISEADLLLGDTDFGGVIQQIIRGLQFKQIIATASVGRINFDSNNNSKNKKTTTYMTADYMQLPENLEFYANEDFKENSLIFVESVEECERLQKILPKAVSLHSELTTESRIDNIEAFRRGDAKFLISTKLGSRGLRFDCSIYIHELPLRVETFLLQCSCGNNESAHVRLKDSIDSARFSSFKDIKVNRNNCIQI